MNVLPTLNVIKAEKNNDILLDLGSDIDSDKDSLSSSTQKEGSRLGDSEAQKFLKLATLHVSNIKHHGLDPITKSSLRLRKHSITLSSYK